jgi:hypothetical protein
MLSALLLILFVTIILNMVVSAMTSSIAPVMIVDFVVVAIALILSRTRFYTCAAALAPIMLAVPSLFGTFGKADPSEIAVCAHLTWLDRLFGAFQPSTNASRWIFRYLTKPYSSWGCAGCFPTPVSHREGISRWASLCAC